MNALKFCLLFLSLILTNGIVSGQNYFQLNSEIGDSVRVEVNQKEYCLLKEPVSIPTHYPMFDTLRFITDAANTGDTILCNFKPDSSYSISLACCGSLDVIQSIKLAHDSLSIWSENEDYQKIQNQLQDLPFISMRIASETIDTIYGWYVDLACSPQFRKLEVNKWEYGVPEKCFYWNNVSPFMFFKSKVQYEKDEQGIVHDFPEEGNVEILATIQIRLFDNARYLLTYYPETKQVSLEYDE